jgi:hypothetical protein
MGIQGAAVASKLACRGFEILDIWILCGIREVFFPKSIKRVLTFGIWNLFAVLCYVFFPHPDFIFNFRSMGTACKWNCLQPTFSGFFAYIQH